MTNNTERDELAQALQAAAKAPCTIRFWHGGKPTGYGVMFADYLLAAGYRKRETEMQG